MAEAPSDSCRLLRYGHQTGDFPLPHLGAEGCSYRVRAERHNRVVPTTVRGNRSKGLPMERIGRCDSLLPNAEATPAIASQDACERSFPSNPRANEDNLRQVLSKRTMSVRESCMHAHWESRQAKAALGRFQHMTFRVKSPRGLAAPAGFRIKGGDRFGVCDLFTSRAPTRSRTRRLAWFQSRTARDASCYPGAHTA